MLLNPPPDSWPLYHGTYDGQRHSKLEQITPQNVSTLVSHGLFRLNQSAELRSTPLMVDGVLYFTVPDNVWAVDALSGHQIWHYTYPPNNGLHIGNRGLAMFKNWLYFLVPDGHLVSLNAKDGSVRWIVPVADSTKGYWTSMAPLVVANHVLVVPQAISITWWDMSGLSIPRPARRSGNGMRRHLWAHQSNDRRQYLDDGYLRS